MKNTIKVLLCLAIISVFGIGVVGSAGAGPERGKVVVAPIEMVAMEIASVKPIGFDTTAVAEKGIKSPYVFAVGTSNAVSDLKEVAVTVKRLAKDKTPGRSYDYDKVRSTGTNCTNACHINGIRNAAGSFYAYPTDAAYSHANDCAIFLKDGEATEWAAGKLWKRTMGRVETDKMASDITLRGPMTEKRPGQMYYRDDRSWRLTGHDLFEKRGGRARDTGNLYEEVSRGTVATGRIERGIIHVEQEKLENIIQLIK